MKIAIIGTGISGNVVAHHLHKNHDITVYEANDYIGGHTHTHDLDVDDKKLRIDSGFIVFNQRTYPNFIALLETLGIEKQKSNMSFSVKCEKTGLEYNGTSLNSLFAQRRNLLRPAFFRMIRDIIRFNRQAPELLMQPQRNEMLGDYLDAGKYSDEFINHYIIPMGSAIWSANVRQMLEFPARYFIRFFANHGMLSVNDRPQWYVVKGGSRSYVDAMIRPFLQRIRLNSPVARIERDSDRVTVTTVHGDTDHYDYVFIATHSNQALAMLAEPERIEQHILGAIPYQKNEAVMHTDTSLLPRRRLAWAAWNYHILPSAAQRVAVTYNMNILQGLDEQQTYCVTLNNTDAIDPARIIKRMSYDHPVYTLEGVSAQSRHSELNGVKRTFYCGAYWGNGFHEDGVVSAMKALNIFFKQVSGHEQLHIRRPD